MLLELALRASTLNITHPSLDVRGHLLDVRFGLWRQAVDGTKIHGAVERKKLWPRQHLATEVKATEVIAAAHAASSHATALKDGDDDDDDSDDGQADQETYDALNSEEIEEEVGFELQV